MYVACSIECDIFFSTTFAYLIPLPDDHYPLYPYRVGKDRRTKTIYDTHTNTQVIELNDKREIVSLVGTLSDGNGHLHVSLSDAQGGVVGGHVLGDLIVFTTAEIVIGECEQITFKREMDPRTGFEN